MCAWEYGFKNHSLFFFFFQKQKKNHEFKGDRDDEGIILFWNIHGGGGTAGRAAVCSMRGENTGPPSGVTGGHRRTHTDIHTQAFTYVLYHREFENTPECTQ